jgi:hypothetical protein
VLSVQNTRYFASCARSSHSAQRTICCGVPSANLLAALFGPAGSPALRDYCLVLEKIGRTSATGGALACGALSAHDDGCRSIREKALGAKTIRRRAKSNAFLRDDDAKNPTRDSGERGDKYRSRQATRRQSQDDRQMEGAGVHIRRENGTKNPRARLLTYEDEAVILAYRWRTRIALDDCHFRLRRLIPKLSRSMLYRCLKRRGLSRVGPTAACPPLTTAALRGPYSFEITVHEVTFLDHDDGIGLCFEILLAVEEITKGALRIMVEVCGCAVF